MEMIKEFLENKGIPYDTNLNVYDETSGTWTDYSLASLLLDFKDKLAQESKNMTDVEKVWEEMENLGWSNKPEDFHMEYFEDIIRATKMSLMTSQKSEYMSRVRICCNVNCNNKTTGKSPYCEFHASM